MLWLNDTSALKITRRQHRRLFTKTCNECDVKEANLPSDEKVIKLTVIHDKAKLRIDVKYKTKKML